LDRNAFDDLVGFPVDKPHHAGLAVGDVYAIEVLPIDYGVRLVDPMNSLKQFPVPNV
jgi:hypothetical protein